MIRGRVLAGDEPRAGVIVSDGVSAAVTDEDGAFSLSPSAPSGPAGHLVWTCVPSGFRPVGRWYHPIGDAELLFRLEPDPGQGTAFSFVFFTDPHLVRDAA